MKTVAAMTATPKVRKDVAEALKSAHEALERSKVETVVPAGIRELLLKPADPYVDTFGITKVEQNKLDPWLLKHEKKLRLVGYYLEYRFVGTGIGTNCNVVLFKQKGDGRKKISSIDITDYGSW